MTSLRENLERNGVIGSLSKINGIAISRCIYDSPKQEVLECYLHGFGDVSNKAYCAVVYFVYRTQDGVHVRLLASRSRVAPLKALTIPRLELMSARILAQLMSTVKTALEAQVNLDGTRYWLDSRTAICWIQNKGGSGNSLSDTGWMRFLSYQPKTNGDIAPENTLQLTLVREERRVESGRSLYTREPGRSEKENCHNGCRRPSPRFDHKCSRHKSIQYNEKINH